MPGNPLAMCYCYTCDREISSMGIMRHRAMHREQREDCTILYCTKGLIEHEFSKLPPCKHPNTFERGTSIRCRDCNKQMGAINA